MLPIPDRQIKREKDDHDKKNPDRPKKTFPDRIPALLGIEKNPEGRQHGHEKKKNFQKTSPKKGSEDSRIQGSKGNTSRSKPEISILGKRFPPWPLGSLDPQTLFLQAVIKLQVLLDQLGDGELIGAAGQAFSALRAVAGLFRDSLDPGRGVGAGAEPLDDGS